MLEFPTRASKKGQILFVRVGIELFELLKELKKVSLAERNVSLILIIEKGNNAAWCLGLVEMIKGKERLIMTITHLGGGSPYHISCHYHFVVKVEMYVKFQE